MFRVNKKEIFAQTCDSLYYSVFSNYKNTDSLSTNSTAKLDMGINRKISYVTLCFICKTYRF